MVFFQPRLVTLVPIATFQPSQTPKNWTFDNMDDMVELQDDPELYQASNQGTVPTGNYVTIINAYGHSRRSSESSSLASLPEDGDCSSDNSSHTAGYSGTHTEAGSSSSSSSRQSSSLSNDLTRSSSLDKVKRVLSKYAAKLRRLSSKGDQRVSVSSGSSSEAFTAATVCGASQGCLVFSPQALQVKTKHWQQASIALAGFASWWKS